MPNCKANFNTSGLGLGLQSLAGLLNWACQAIRGGRFFLRRILDSLPKLKQGRHKVRLSADFHLDVDWWYTYLHAFSGVVYYTRQPEHILHADACTEAAGMFYNGDWQYVVWSKDWPHANPLHINYKEVLAVVCAARIWAPWWQDSTVHVYTDSTVAKAGQQRQVSLQVSERGPARALLAQ